MVLADVNDLCNIVVGTEGEGANVHMDVILQEVHSKSYTQEWSNMQT